MPIVKCTMHSISTPMISLVSFIHPFISAPSAVSAVNRDASAFTIYSLSTMSMHMTAARMSKRTRLSGGTASEI